MKRIGIVLSLLLLSLSLYAAPGFGYSIAPVGEKTPSGTTFGAVGFAAMFSPFGETHYADIEAEVLLAPVSPVFHGVNLKISSPIFNVLVKPLRLFPNSVLWSPKLVAGTQYRVQDGWLLYMSLAPLSFQDMNYVYEFFTPYALYDIRNNSWGYGAYIMRFTAYIGG